jgi:membrane protease subunit (stomatin/prohibitin family)
MVLRRRALLRGAMVGGAAYYAGRKISQGEQREYEQQQRLEMLEAQQAQPQYAAPQYAPAPPAAPQKSVSEQLTELKQLLDAGVLTQPEFDAAKAKVLRG